MSTKNEELLYAVIAYKYGMSDNHSYLVGIYRTEEAAKDAAHKEVEWRGGKYGCEVVRVSLQDEWDSESEHTQIYYVESPYHGMLGCGSNVADRSSEHCIKKAIAALKRKYTTYIT